MIIIYSLPNVLTIPYQIDGVKGYHTFRPGKNQVPDRIWEAIKSQNKARFDNYYSGIMREFNLPPEAINPPDEGEELSRYNNFPTSSIDSPDEVQYFEPLAPKGLASIFSTGSEGATDSGETLVDTSRIDQIRQDLDLIENTMGLEEPGICPHDEKRDERQLKRPGRAAVKTINGRIAEINDFAARIREKKPP